MAVVTATVAPAVFQRSRIDVIPQTHRGSVASDANNAPLPT